MTHTNFHETVEFYNLSIKHFSVKLLENSVLMEDKWLRTSVSCFFLLDFTAVAIFGCHSCSSLQCTHSRPFLRFLDICISKSNIIVHFYVIYKKRSATVNTYAYKVGQENRKHMPIIEIGSRVKVES